MVEGGGVVITLEHPTEDGRLVFIEPEIKAKSLVFDVEQVRYNADTQENETVERHKVTAAKFSAWYGTLILEGWRLCDEA